MNPYLAVIRPAEKNPSAAARLIATSRKLAETLRRTTGMKVTAQRHQNALLLVTGANRELSQEEQDRATAALQAQCDTLWAPGTMSVSAHTRANLPASLV